MLCSIAYSKYGVIISNKNEKYQPWRPYSETVAAPVSNNILILQFLALMFIVLVSRCSVIFDGDWSSVLSSVVFASLDRHEHVNLSSRSSAIRFAIHSLTKRRRSMQSKHLHPHLSIYVQSSAIAVSARSYSTLDGYFIQKRRKIAIEANLMQYV